MSQNRIATGNCTVLAGHWAGRVWSQAAWMLLSFRPKICINLHFAGLIEKQSRSDKWHFKETHKLCALRQLKAWRQKSLVLTPPVVYDLLDAWMQLNHWQICCLSKSSRNQLVGNLNHSHTQSINSQWALLLGIRATDTWNFQTRRPIRHLTCDCRIDAITLMSCCCDFCFSSFLNSILVNQPGAFTLPT